ncbi:hypothetical protein GALMADRAFT_137466 [Galerina marginata CBS 339.88]|uniref:MYND-type domain-containing protein n=1 Tax=Galerina marginata (strain CBS 339.88) TaxID=685588 RepID=A0A067TL32_GALM3|nr:hypothetical protein GALMADRAFT_137466 [Galerina marginata CBS 339.88]
MKLTCYYCNTDLPSNKIKRCSRCLLVTYCSKECQAFSWKASHKLNCKIHPSNLSTTNPGQLASKDERPAKFSPEWIELGVDRELSRWLQLWRACFQTWTTIGLDLANHPADRVMTHCMRLVVQPRNFVDDPAKQYQVLEAAIVPISWVRTAHPDFEIHIDPTDFTRLRYLIVLQNYKGEMRRLRLIQWNTLSTEKWQKIGKEASATLAAGFGDALMLSTDSSSPSQVEKKLGIQRS